MSSVRNFFGINIHMVSTLGAPIMVLKSTIKLYILGIIIPKE